ncbi:hypothetical protein FAI40_03160 [Acetobacteraceae bacterium]|nr:hypothetical protein FAI40_03160 [Acetobacteraceae bacterium]
MSPNRFSFLFRTGQLPLALLLMGISAPSFASNAHRFGEHYAEERFHTLPKREVLTMAPSCGHGPSQLLVTHPGSGRCHLNMDENKSHHSNTSLKVRAGNRSSSTAHHSQMFSSRRRSPALVQDPD